MDAGPPTQEDPTSPEPRPETASCPWGRGCSSGKWTELGRGPGLPLALGPVLSVQRSGLTSCVHCCDSRLGSPQTPPLGRQCRAGRHGHRPALSAGLSRAVPNSVCPSGFLSAWKGGREAFGHLLSAVPCPPWPVPSTSSGWVRMWRVWCLITCGHGSVLDEEATARAGPGPCCQVILQAPGKRLRPFCHLPRQKPVRLT